MTALPAPTEDMFCLVCGGPVAGERCALCRRSPAEVAEALAVDRAAAELGDRPSDGDVMEKPARRVKPGRPLLLEDPEPWPEPVDPAAVLDEAQALVRQHVELPPEAADAAALYAAFTYSVDRFDIAPLLVVSSPTLRCGKSTLLRVLAALVRRPLPASNVTGPALFRAIERWSPTLLVDEADTWARASDELRGILNSGHTRDLAYVVRTVGDDYEPRLFCTFGAKVVALIGRLSPTVEDRAVRIELRRRSPGARIMPIEAATLAATGGRLQRQFARFAEGTRLPGALVERLPGLDDRAWDNWRPLVAIAEGAGGDWPARARAAAVALSVDRDEDSTAALLLRHTFGVFEAAGAERLPTAELLAALVDREDGPWAGWWADAVDARRTKGPASKLARLLRPFGIQPVDIRLGERTLKGYRRGDFETVWETYLPQPPRGERDNATSQVDAHIKTRHSGETGAVVSRSHMAPEQACRVVASSAGQEALPVVSGEVMDPAERETLELVKRELGAIEVSTAGHVRTRRTQGADRFTIARELHEAGAPPPPGFASWTAAAVAAVEEVMFR